MAMPPADTLFVAVSPDPDVVTSEPRVILDTVSLRRARNWFTVLLPSSSALQNIAYVLPLLGVNVRLTFAVYVVLVVVVRAIDS